MRTAIDKSPGADREQRLRHATITMVGLLLTQFLLGIATNLYVTIPHDHPGTKEGYFAGIAKGIGWAIGKGPVPLAIHAALGSALLLVAITIVVLAVRSRTRQWVACALTGLLAITAAWFNGVSFINLGQHNINSMIMSAGFAAATAAYTTALSLRHIVTRGLRHVPPPTGSRTLTGT